MPILMPDPDCGGGLSDDFGGCLLFFFFFDCGVDAGTHWPLSFSILPDSQRHDLPSKILPPLQIWGGGQFPSELRGLPSGHAVVPPPGGLGSTMKHRPPNPLRVPGGQAVRMPRSGGGEHCSVGTGTSPEIQKRSGPGGPETSRRPSVTQFEYRVPGV
jgi:hypothetical protein